jgi:2',3'-cyclic-nucleotide 2'-phosphodiesterase (5'-nucleotidase family)
MKKILAMLLVIVLCVSFVACNGGVLPDDSDITSSDDTATDGGSKPDGGTPDGGSSDGTTPENNKKPDLDVEGHSDVNNDKTCDDCGISVVTTFDFYAINDLHGKFVNSANTVGVEGLTTYLQRATARDDNPVLLSSGDMWQGGAQSNLTKGLIITDWMNYMDFASMTLGNHEFDWGEEYIIENAALAEFPMLAINIYDRTTNQRVEYCESSVLVECRGLQVGIIGAIGDHYSSISGDKSQNIYFKTGSELTALVKAESDKLRAAGADLIVYSLHSGYGSNGSGSISNGALASYYDIALSDGYVDIVFEGHTHRNYVLRDGKHVYHMQNKGDNGGISHAELEYNFANGNYSVIEAEHISSDVYRGFDAAAIVAQLLEKYKDMISKADDVLGNNDKNRDGATLLSTVAQLYYEAGYERWGSQYDIVLGGAFMTVRSPGYLRSGSITYADLQAILPFDNELVLCSIKGRDLVNRFLSPNDNYYTYCGDYGNSIKNNIDYNATYYIISDTYSSTYAPNKLTEIARYGADVFARDLLAEYIREGNFSTGVSKTATISEILEIGSRLSANEETSEAYRVSGVIVDVYNTTYGNMIIADEHGARLTVYGVSDIAGTRYDKLASKPAVGDTVTLEAPIKRYVNNSTGEDIIELFQSTLVT